MFHFNLAEKQFSGPLDLLLALINEQKLAISELSISKVTEQYIDHLNNIEEKNPDELADFLVIATRLLFLKSKALLPQLMSEEDDGPSLEEQLKLYEKFIKASHTLNNLWQNNFQSYPRLEPPRKLEKVEIPQNVSVENLHKAMLKLLSRLKPPKALPETSIDSTVSLKERMFGIRELLKKQKQINFKNILSNAENRTEIIINFLAVLELVKQRNVFLNQKNNFGEIWINRV